MIYDSSGSIRIRAYAASGALPIEGVLVKIYGADEYNRDVMYSLITDVDGVTTKTLSCTFNQLSSVVGIQSIRTSSNGGYVSKFAILSLSISGNTVTANIKHDSNGSDNNITYTITAIGY